MLLGLKGPIPGNMESERYLQITPDAVSISNFLNVTKPDTGLTADPNLGVVVLYAPDEDPEPQPGGNISPPINGGLVR